MSNKNILSFGKDNDSNAQPIGVAGEHNNKLIVISIDKIDIFEKILKELKIFNTQLEMITQTKLTKQDAENYKQKL